MNEVVRANAYRVFHRQGEFFSRREDEIEEKFLATEGAAAHYSVVMTAGGFQDFPNFSASLSTFRNFDFPWLCGKLGSLKRTVGVRKAAGDFTD